MTPLDDLSNEELDALVATEVMGWEQRSVESGHLYWITDGQPTTYRVRTDDHRIYPVPDTWSPSTSIADAWEVVERLCANPAEWSSIGCEWAVEGPDPEWFVEFRRDSSKNDPWVTVGSASANTAPRAICLAALRAAGETR